VVGNEAVLLRVQSSVVAAGAAGYEMSGAVSAALQCFYQLYPKRSAIHTDQVTLVHGGGKEVSGGKHVSLLLTLSNTPPPRR
jgi:hypothetical protein